MAHLPNHCGHGYCRAAIKLDWTGDGFARRMQAVRTVMRKISPEERQTAREAAAVKAAEHEAERRHTHEEAQQWRARRVQDLENWKAHRGQAAVASAACDVEKGA